MGGGTIPGSVPSQQQSAGESTVSVQDFQSRHFDLPTAPQCSASTTPSKHTVDVALPDQQPWLGWVGVYLPPDDYQPNEWIPETLLIVCGLPPAVLMFFHTFLTTPPNFTARWDFVATGWLAFRSTSATSFRTILWVCPRSSTK